MMDLPLIVLDIFVILLAPTMLTAADSTPRPPQEWPPELLTLPPLLTAVQHFPPSFCHSGASLEDISLDDCGSCQGRCGVLNNMQRQEGLCSCDSACVVYDDCCWDFQQQCPELHERAVDIRNAFDVMPSSICFSMYVDTHPSGNENVLLINSCEGTTCDHPKLIGVPDPHTQVPVQDLDTGIFYINFNCALCNGARRLQAIGVHLNYRTDVNAPHSYSIGETTTTAPPAFSTADEVVEAMPLRLVISYSFPGTQARRCLPSVVDQCSETCDNRDLIDLCRTGGQSYTSGSLGQPTYRNIYCALCNFRQLEQLHCSNYFTTDESQSGDPITFSLSFLFDLQELESPSVNSISLHCMMDGAELPEGVVCGETVCPRGYTLHDDTCRANYVSAEMSADSQPVVNGTYLSDPQFVSPCKGARLPESAFTIENGSLVLTSNGHVYNEGEYIMENASAVLCLNSKHTDFSAQSALGITTIILCSISLLGLICRLVLQPFRPQYKTFPGRMQFNLVLALALAIALLLLSPLASDVDKLCFTLAVLKYFAFLASFVWMTCVAGDTCWALRRSLACRNPQKGPNLLRYLLIGWFLPSIITIILLSIDLSKADTSLAPQFGGRGCWITRKLPLVLFFFVPFFISVILNIVLFMLTVRFLKSAFQESNVIRKSKDSQHPWRVYVKLFIIMGLTWLVGCVAIWVNSIVAWFLFVILNASQGIFIFLAFVVKFSKLKTMCSCFKHEPVSVPGKRSSSDHTAPTQTTKLHHEHEAVAAKAMIT